MIEYIEEQLRRGYEFYLNVDNLTRFQGLFKKNGNIVNIHSELLTSLFEYDNLYNSLLDNSKYLKIVFNNDEYILERYAIIKNGIYGSLSKYGVDKRIKANNVDSLFNEYGNGEKQIEKVL